MISHSSVVFIFIEKNNKLIAKALKLEITTKNRPIPSNDDNSHWIINMMITDTSKLNLNN